MVRFGKALLNTIGWTLLYLPAVIGYTYSAALLCLVGATAFMHGMGFTALIIMLIGYALLIVPTFWMLTIFEFRHCCIGMKSFRSHMAEPNGTKGVLLNLACSLVWPLAWHGFADSMLGWRMTWFETMIEPTAYRIGTIKSGRRTAE
jgi:hypothetical protein